MWAAAEHLDELDEATYRDVLEWLALVDQLEELRETEADPEACAYIEKYVLMQAVITATLAARVEEPEPERAMSEAEFRRKWITPTKHEASLVMHRMERRHFARLRPARVVRCPSARPRAPRRHADRRAAGLRSGTDPGDGDPEPESALSAAVTAPAHALNDGNSPYTRADRARGSRPVFVLYERHPVHGLINRPLGRFLGGKR